MNKRYVEVSSVPMFCEFFDTLLHGFLYSRGLYPFQAFELRKKYGVPVQICTHMEVRNYINSIARSLTTMMEQHQIEKLEVVVFDSSKNIIKEKLVIEPMSLPRFEIGTLTVEELFTLEQLLRTGLLKVLQSFQTQLDYKMAPNLTWKVRALTKLSTYFDLLEKQKTSGELFWHFDENDSFHIKKQSIFSGNEVSNIVVSSRRDEEMECDDIGDGQFTVIPLKNIKSKFMEIHLHLEDYSCQEL